MNSPTKNFAREVSRIPQDRKMSLRDYPYYKSVFQDQRMPFAFVDLDLLEENATELELRSADKLIRIASKSIRSVGILKHIFSLSDRFKGIMCFSAAEAVFLSQKGFDDLLMGYPVFQEADIVDICCEVQKGKNIICMVDSPDHVIRLNQIASAKEVEIPVCIDGDMSIDYPGIHFGVYRSPVTDVESALKVFDAIENASHIRLDGFMGYEAQIAGVTDNLPGNGLKNAVIRFLKKNSIRKVADRRAAIVKAIEDNGGKFRVVNGGGTGSLESTIQEAAVTEVTVGSGFFNSHLFDNYANFRHSPAAGYAVQVVRIPKPGMVTCHGGGYVASGPPGKDKIPLPYLPEGLQLTEHEAAGEVQTPLKTRNSHSLKPGDPVFFRHAKAGELCERFNSLLLVRNGKVVDEIPTYRGEGKCFL